MNIIISALITLLSTYSYNHNTNEYQYDHHKIKCCSNNDR